MDNQSYYLWWEDAIVGVDTFNYLVLSKETCSHLRVDFEIPKSSLIVHVFSSFLQMLELFYGKFGNSTSKHTF